MYRRSTEERGTIRAAAQYSTALLSKMGTFTLLIVGILLHFYFNSATTSPPASVDRLGYGIYFKYLKTVKITTQIYRSSFVYQLPDLDTVLDDKLGTKGDIQNPFLKNEATTIRPTQNWDNGPRPQQNRDNGSHEQQLKTYQYRVQFAVNKGH